MRYLLLIPLMVFSSSLFAQNGLPSDQKSVRQILEGPALTADEQTKIRFDAQVDGGNPPTFTYRIYNGLRDKTILGFVVTIAAKDAKEKVEETDVFVSVNLGPLASTQGSSMYFVNFGNAPTNATFTLKEVLCEAQVGKPKPKAKS